MEVLAELRQRVKAVEDAAASNDSGPGGVYTVGVPCLRNRGETSRRATRLGATCGLGLRHGTRERASGPCSATAGSSPRMLWPVRPGARERRWRSRSEPTGYEGSPTFQWPKCEHRSDLLSIVAASQAERRSVVRDVVRTLAS
jgi:hypothetical protein